MAMIRYGSGAIEYNGRYGGGYFRRDQCMNHWQAWARENYRDTPEQKKQKRYWQRVTIAWSNFKHHPAFPLLYNMWWIWCADNPHTNKKGITIYFHPFIAFIHVNVKRLRAGKHIIYDPYDA